MFVAGLLLVIIGALLIALLPQHPIPEIGKVVMVIGVVVIVLWIVVEVADGTEAAVLLPLL